MFGYLSFGRGNLLHDTEDGCGPIGRFTGITTDELGGGQRGEAAGSVFPLLDMPVDLLGDFPVGRCRLVQTQDLAVLERIGKPYVFMGHGGTCKMIMW